MSYIEYSILGLIIITLILVTTLFIKLYLKIKSADKDNINVIEFPKETKDNINNFINHSRVELMYSATLSSRPNLTTYLLYIYQVVEHS